jgi:hypothetical protein
MRCKPLSLLKLCFFILLVMIALDVHAQYYRVYPASNKNINCVYGYKLHHTLSGSHKNSGNYSIETYTMGLICPCSNAAIKGTDPSEYHLNDNFYGSPSFFYENYNGVYNEDGRTGNDGTADLNIDH